MQFCKNFVYTVIMVILWIGDFMNKKILGWGLPICLAISLGITSIWYAGKVNKELWSTSEVNSDVQERKVYSSQIEYKNPEMLVTNDEITDVVYSSLTKYYDSDEGKNSVSNAITDGMREQIVERVEYVVQDTLRVDGLTDAQKEEVSSIVNTAITEYATILDTTHLRKNLMS